VTEDVDGRAKPGHDEEESVGWAKALLRRAHLLCSDVDGMVGTPPDAFASGAFAHPTHLYLTRPARPIMVLSGSDHTYLLAGAKQRAEILRGAV
jgi:hypothetical protein